MKNKEGSPIENFILNANSFERIQYLWRNIFGIATALCDRYLQSGR